MTRKERDAIRARCEAATHGVPWVDHCRIAGVPVFLKNNLASIWGKPLIQQYPWEAS